MILKYYVTLFREILTDFEDVKKFLNYMQECLKDGKKIGICLERYKPETVFFLKHTLTFLKKVSKSLQKFKFVFFYLFKRQPVEQCRLRSGLV